MGRHNLLEFRSWLAHAVWAALAFVVVAGGWWLVGQLSNPLVLADNGSSVYRISSCTTGNWVKAGENITKYRVCRLANYIDGNIGQLHWGCFVSTGISIPPDEYTVGDTRLGAGGFQNPTISFEREMEIVGGTLNETSDGILTNGVEDVSCETFEGRSTLLVSCSNVEATITSGGYAGGFDFNDCTLEVPSTDSDPSTPTNPSPTTDPEPDPASDEASPGEDFGQHICRGDDCGFLDTVDSFLRWLSFLVVPIVIIVVIVGGIQLSLAGDNPEATKKAKAKITQAIVALVFFILLWGLLKWLI